MAIVIRNVKGGDLVAAATAISQNLQAQSTSATSGWFHADSTSNNLTPESAFNIPRTPQGQYVVQSPSVDLLSAQQLAAAIAGGLIGNGQTADPPAHFYDAPNSNPVPISLAGAHAAVDNTNTALLSAYLAFLTAGGIGGASQTDTNTFVNAIKTYFNAHLTQSGVHYNNDTTNTEGVANATTLNTCIALINSLRNHINTHVAHANANYPQIRIVPA